MSDAFGQALLFGVALLGACCTDPLRERRIEALGPEQLGVSPGPLHRPGQPCLACHDGEDSSVPRHSVAGTVYVDTRADQTAANVLVELVDARAERFELTSNCAGNFYVEGARFEPVYPLWTALRFEDERIQMQSSIGRDGSCASCHALSASNTATGAVYLYSLPSDDSPGLACP
jgi:hypothetical protein